MRRKNNDRINILLVSNDKAEINGIELHCKESKKLRCKVQSFGTMQTALHTLNENRKSIDVVILDLALAPIDCPCPIETYMKVAAVARDIPIIVVTGKSDEEHELAKFILKSGAADNIVRGELKGLVNSVQFAMIRQKITRKLKYKHIRRLERIKQLGKAEVQREDEQRMKDLLEYQEALSLFMDGYSATDYRPKNL